MRLLIPLILAAVLLNPSSVHGQFRFRGPAGRTIGEQIPKILDQTVRDQRQSVARITRDGESVALATIVSADGYLVTKASELKDGYSVVLPDGREFESPRFSTDRANDLALVKIPASDLKPVCWTNTTDVRIGHWITGFGAESTSLRVGIVSARRRPIERVGVLGVVLGRFGEDAGGGVRIDFVTRGSGAASAGIRRRDVIKSVNGEEVSTRDQLQKAVTAHEPGEKVEIILQRRGEAMTVTVTLGDKSEVFSGMDDDLEFSGETSKWRTGFSEAIQHDAPFGARAMGGPLLSLQGAAFGINIARFDRVATYALPSEVVQSVIEQLKEGFEKAEEGVPAPSTED